MGDKEYTVILRVKEIPKEDASSVNDDWMCCSPVDTEYPPNREYMWLKKSRLLEGTWRYSIPGEGDNILIVSGVGTLMMYNVCSNTIKDYHIILDPPAPEPMPEWEQEVRDILTPVISLERVDRLIGALRKMKEGEDG